MVTKRGLDILLSLAGLVIFLPIWILITLLILLIEGRPVFYVQDRVGKDGKIFKGLKFRSMVKGAEEGMGPVQARADDPRITRIGRLLRATAMDELPQLINILKGEMSFVGPRAVRPFEIELYGNAAANKTGLENRLFIERSKIKPGLTGIAQILVGRDMPRVAKFRYDIWYVDNMSFFLDVYILVMSVVITLLARWDSPAKKIDLISRRLKAEVEKGLEISLNRRMA